jgi:RNA polymerase sigma-70 factor (ECF subfamily)
MLADQETSDEALLDLIVNGEKGAMQVLFDRHNVRLFRFLMRLVDNQGVAEDLVNEVFVEVWRDAPKVGRRRHVATWLLAIARHKAISVLPQSSAEERGSALD